MLSAVGKNLLIPEEEPVTAKDKLTDINNSVNINDEITAKNASIFTFSNNNNDNIRGNSIASTSAQYLTFETIENEKPMRKKKLLEKAQEIINDGHLYQALAELTAGDLKSTHAVLAVLTYLRDDWQFFYFNDKRIALIQINMKSANQELNHETEVTDPLPKRQKLKHIYGYWIMHLNHLFIRRIA
ncbi:hypothetical protein RhiirB3_427468 [Rhizophagus irregularis]|nr:hypothetical protein RhiirB3_427468 [Rhizophagus irregularis]